MKKILVLLILLVLVFGFSSLIRASVAGDFTVNPNPTDPISPGTTNVLILDLTLPTPYPDSLIDGDGSANPGLGNRGSTATISAGDVLTAFGATDDVYWDDTGTTGVVDAGDSIWIDKGGTAGTYDAGTTGTSTGATINLDAAGYTESPSAITDMFTIITGTNDAIVYDIDDTTDCDAATTVTLAAGTYTGAQLATEAQTKLNAVVGVDTSVSYDAATDKFTVDADTVGAVDDVCFAAAGSTTAATLGHTANVLDGASVAGANAVAFNIINGTNDQLDLTIDGTACANIDIAAGVYTASTLVTALQSVIDTTCGAGQATASHASDKFRITSNITTLRSTPGQSSIAVTTDAQSAETTLGLGSDVPVDGDLTITNGTDDQIKIAIHGYTAVEIDFVSVNTNYIDLDVLVTDMNTAIDATTFSTTADVIASASTDKLVFTTIDEGPNVSVAITAGTNDARAKIGLSTPTEAAGTNDVVLYGSPTSGTTTGNELSATSPLAYNDADANGGTPWVTTGDGIYQDGQDIYFDAKDSGTTRWYRADKLSSIKIRNAGSAVDGDITKLQIWEDGSTAGWSGDETSIGSDLSSPFWDQVITVSATQHATSGTYAPYRRIFVMIDVSSSAGVNRTFQAQLVYDVTPANAPVQLVSTNDGPTDANLAALTRSIIVPPGVGFPMVPLVEEEIPEEEVVEEVPPVEKPIEEMTVEELEAEIERVTAFITQLQTQLAALKEEAPTTEGCTITSFDRNLSQGMSGDDVNCLQIVLNLASDTQLADSGIGSPGEETSYLGPLTKTSVIKFQEKYADDVLASWGLTTGTGFVGITTREKLNELYTGQ